MKKLLTILFLAGSLYASSQCTHNVVTLALTDFNAKEAYYPNGISSLHPGDTLKIPKLAGNAVYSNIQIDTINGTAGCPITITFTGGVVPITQMRISASNPPKTSTYFHITGNGQAGIHYGAKLGVLSIGVAAHYQIDSIETAGQDNGLFFHVNPDPSVPRTVYPNFVFDSVHVHDCYVHKSNGEGMYIGHTYPSGDPYSGGYVPIRMRRVEIDHNIVDSTGWDGIQLSNAQDGCSIHDNTVTNFGYSDIGSQRAGIIGGANSKVRIYNNTVRQGTGNGIQGFGYDTLEVDHNTVQNVGNTLDDGCSGCRGEQTFFIKAQLNIETRAKQFVYVHDNIIIAPKTRGILQTNNDANYSDTAKFLNNQICFNGSVPTGWQTSYISIAQAHSVVTGNTAVVCTSPIANAGPDQGVVLPTNSLNITGSGIAGTGHSITTYLWTQVSGPNTTFIFNSNLTTCTPTGLIQGVYVIRLTVTQDDAQTAFDDVQVTVSPATVTPSNLKLKWMRQVKIR